MKRLLVPIKVVAVIYGLLAALLALVGSFADGEEVWARLLVTLLQPLSAVGLLAAAFVKTLGKLAIVAIAALLLATAVADGYFALAIANGSVKGDWQLPAVLAVIPVLGFLYAVSLLKVDTPQAVEG